MEVSPVCDSLDSSCSPGSSRDVVRRLYDACGRNDLGELLDCLADDVVVHEPALLPYGGEYRGHREVREMLRRIAGYLDVSQFKAEQIAVDGNVVFGLLRIPDRVTGIDVVLAEQLVVRGGKVAEMRIFVHDRQSLSSCGGAEVGG